MPTPKKKTVKSGSKTAKRKPKGTTMRPVQPDDKLEAIVGSKQLPRSELAKLGDYIKKHDRQMRKPDLYRTRSGGAAPM